MSSSRENFLLIFLACFFCHAVSVEAGCVQLDACSCRDTSSGRLISLHALANTEGKAAFTVGDPNTPEYIYRYNPCFNLSKPDGAFCRNVSLCQTGTRYNDDYSLGKQETAVFKETEEGFLTISYVGQLICDSPQYLFRVPTIYLVCDLDGLVESSKFAFVREPTLGRYTFVLTSRCACPGGCSGPFPAVMDVQSVAACKPDEDHPCGCRLTENDKLLSVSAGKLRNVEVPSPTFVVANKSKIFFNQCGNVGVPASVCHDSAVCLQTEDGDFQDFGQVSSVQFVVEGSGVDPNVTIHMTSSDGRRQSRVRLVCDRYYSRSLPPNIIVRGLSATDVVLEARSECACPGRCETIDRLVQKTAIESVGDDGTCG